MWCGPDAVARLTGWTRIQVWLHIRWLRERQGRTLTDVPRGGTNCTELFSALDRAGFAAVPWGLGVRRMDYRVFARTVGRSGRWLVLQRKHFDVHDAREPWPDPPGGGRHAAIIKAWHVRRKASSTEGKP